MRLEDERVSRNVEDRRGMSIGRGGAVGGGIGVVILAIVAMFFGIDPGVVLQTAEQMAPLQQQQQQAPGQGGIDDEGRQFISRVLGSTEQAWGSIFQNAGRRYPEPQLVLFSGAVQSACGMAQAAVGPFYCGADQKVYIDLSFYRDLRERFRAPGDFAQAYVVAHEIGHHVQNVLGIMQKVQGMQQRAGEREANALSVRLELQADCFAGIWAHHANRERRILEPGDVEEGLRAAAAIGDDRIQMQSRGYVSPESFTHGSAEQRVRWFRAGLESGDMRACDTFSGRV